MPLSAGTGSNPQLPEPRHTARPTVNVATAKGWPLGGKPKAASGTAVSLFADRLDHPRWIYVLPNGDVLVAETNGPPRPEDKRGIRGWAMSLIMKKGGTDVPSANRITLLRDADADGVPETRTVFLDGLNSPFGMTLVGRDFYVANTDAILRFPYTPGATSIAASGTLVADLPAGPLKSPLDEEPHREPRRIAALRHCWLEQQRRGEWPRQGGGSRRDMGGGPRERGAPGVRNGTSQPERHGVGAEPRLAVDGGQRT